MALARVHITPFAIRAFTREQPLSRWFDGPTTVPYKMLCRPSRRHSNRFDLRYDLAKLSLPNWRGFLVFRERSESAVLSICAKLFPRPNFSLEVVPLAT
jgi:hypothetical protein